MQRKLLLAAGLTTALVLGSVSVAMGGANGTFTSTEHGRATATSSEEFAVKAGTNLVIQRFVLEPGWSSGWHYHPDDAWVLINTGELVQYSGCNERTVWTPGNAYFHANGEHRQGHGEAPELARNESAEPVDITVIFLNVPKDAPPAPASSPFANTPRTFNPPPAECPTLN